MNLAPRARGEEVARSYCAFHGHKIVQIIEDTHPGSSGRTFDNWVCEQCGATLREIREHSDIATHAVERLTINP